MPTKIQNMIATQLKTGTIFKEDGAPFQVVKYEHIKVARGGANVKVKAKNLLTGAVLEKGYLATSKVEEADVVRGNLQYLYKNGPKYVFMDQNTYEQTEIDSKVIGDAKKFMQEGDKISIMYFEGRPVSVELPKTVVFEVEYTEPGFKGNTATNTLKDATLTNSTQIKVPTFIKIGDKVKINTDTGEYISKA